MEPIADNTIMETGAASVAAPFDLAQARANVAALRAEVEAQEIAIAGAELAQAEAAHGELYAKCVEAQDAFDTINREVETQTHLAYQSSTRRAGAAQQLDMHQRNTPEKQQQNLGTVQRYGDKSIAEWQAGLEHFLEEQREAEKEHGEVFAVLLNMQGQRRQAAKTLETLSWEEGHARDRVAVLRRKRDAMNPPPTMPARTMPARTEPILNGATLVLTSDNSVRADLRTRVAATR